MSDGPQGEGWWVASDGRWYPPELHPDAMAAPRAGGAPALGHAEGGWPAPAPDPWIARMQAQAAAGGAPAEAGAPATWAAGPGGPAPRRLRGRALPRRKAPVALAVAVVLLAGAGVGLALALSGPSAANTPQAVAEAVVGDFRSDNLPQLCDLATPAMQAQCRVTMLVPAAFKLTTRQLAVGVVTEQGNQALAVLTGTVCASAGTIVQPQCVSNSDPNVALDHAQSFAQAFSAAQGSSKTTNFTIPMVNVGGKWYLAIP